MQGRWLLGCGLVAGLAGCGLGLTGLDLEHENADADAGAARDASPGGKTGTDLDAGVAVDSAPVEHEAAPQAPCTDGIPPGWSLALYATGGTACPGSNTATHDGVAGGDAGAGACACSCSVNGPVTCETGTLQIAAGSSSASCNGSPTSVSVDSDFCAPLPAAQMLNEYVAVAALPPSGTCSSAVVTDATKLAKSDVHWCDVADASAEAVCAGSAPPGFVSCIAHAGAVACPSGGAFATRTVASDDVSLSCSACSTCQLTGTCGAATVAFFSDGNCNNAIIAVNADGKCNLTASPNIPFSSVLYNGALLDAGSCAASGSTPTVSPTGTTTTLCCR
jgi:hypothetical protein